MMPAWFARMNPRERMLSLGVAGVVFVLFNLLIWSWLLGAVATARAEVATREAKRKEQAVYVKERDLWTKRDQWLQQHQLVLKNSGEASTLLEQLKQIADKYKILIENPAARLWRNNAESSSGFCFN